MSKVRASSDIRRCDVLIIGGGPSGSSCAYWLAKGGWDVVVVEKKVFPREKTCGDGLTPRSVRPLLDMGLAAELESHHRYEGLRAVAFGKTLELTWPATPGFPQYGYCVTRYDLDAMVANNATKAGAELLSGTSALEPIFDESKEGSKRVIGAKVVGKSGQEQSIYSSFVVVADGANSRIGRELGLNRDKDFPMGLAIRGYFNSPRHDDPFIESHLDIRDDDGKVIPGYGWIFPLGDGRVNVGAGLLNTSSRWKGFNTTKLMEAFVRQAPKSWGINEENACNAPTGGRLPMGLCIGPRSGSSWIAVGDAIGSINPFNGEGIAYGYETGRLGATVLDEALRSLKSNDLNKDFHHSDSILASYDKRLEENYREYYRVASLFVDAISNPALLKIMVGTGMYSKTVMEWVLRVMANLLRPDETGPAEAVIKFAEWSARKFRPVMPSTVKF